ncbi:hypothetical protein Z949_4119 [Sulfitobacter guttiformis KCTC 32187]|nr:hypothetical protein Z949_4119 [Sulfitobacter guttiformis KCTC 32187]
MPWPDIIGLCDSLRRARTFMSHFQAVTPMRMQFEVDNSPAKRYVDATSYIKNL